MLSQSMAKQPNPPIPAGAGLLTMDQIDSPLLRRSIRYYRAILSAFLAVADAVSVVFADVLADTVLAVADRPQASRHLAAAITGALILIPLASSLRLYTPNGTDRRMLRLGPIFGAWSATTVVVLAIGSLWSGRWALSSGWLVVWYLFGIILLKATRIIATWGLRVVRPDVPLASRLAIVGAPTAALSTALAQLEGQGQCQVLGLFHEQPDQWPQTASLPWLGRLEDLPSDAARLMLDAIILVVPPKPSPQFGDMCERLRAVPIDVWLAPDLGDFPVRADGRSMGLAYPLIRLWETPLRNWRGINKRIEDIVLGSLALAFFLPVMGLIALAIWRCGDGPVLHRQLRYGYNNKPFTMLKFRTMRSSGGDGSGAIPTVRNDVRVTRLGRFLRSTSLDELPQLFNVLRSEMSLVGPRAHPVEMRVGGANYNEVVRFYAARHRMKPGITGLAQVNGHRGIVDTPEKAQSRLNYDLEYVESWTLWLDIRILARTVISGFVHKNAY